MDEFSEKEANTVLFTLPPIDKEPIPLSHFPTRHQAFIFRASEYVPAEKIASVLRTTAENVQRAAEDMGIPHFNPENKWLKRGYITIIRRMWHILPYEQLFELLDTDKEAFARLLREEDFLDVKLEKKPRCKPVLWRELSDKEREQTKKIKQIMRELDFSGRAPFEFKYSVPSIKFKGKERFSTRMIYAFSGMYQHAFDIDSEEYLPDEQLKAYQSLGINGIWTQGILSQISHFPFDPALSAGYEKRLERMRALTERLDKFGIRLYLYLNEPRGMPIGFFDGKPELMGHVRGDFASLCTSVDAVKDYLRDAVEEVCRAVPKLGGFFGITRSENLTNCFSHSGTPDAPCNCPRCKDRSAAEVISEVLGCFLEGARRVSEDIRVFAWSWRWDEESEAIINRLPRGIILLSQSELDIPFEIGGVRGNVLDYSMSIIGPGTLARREWKLARERGLEIGAKVQINTTWEASTVPAIPVSPSIDEHIRGLHGEGVRHLLLSWTLGGYPGRNIATAAKHFYENAVTEASNPALYEAEKQFVRAFREFPFHLDVLYNGPQNAGPSSLLFEKPTGYTASMTCFAYDDLESWRGIYPIDVFEAQFARLCEEWEIGLKMLPTDCDREAQVMARATYCLFKSSLNQIRFIRARNDNRFEAAIAEAKNEIGIAKEMLSLMNENSAIGYEAANHYYFSKGQLAEKIINCHTIIGVFDKMTPNN